MCSSGPPKRKPPQTHRTDRVMKSKNAFVRASAALGVWALAVSLACGAPLAPRAKIQFLESLKRQGFEWPIEPAGWTVNFVGAIRSGGVVYKIYQCQWTDPHPLPGGAVHGEQRFVVTAPHGRYVGAYLTNADFRAVRGRDIEFKVAKKDGDRIHFGRHGPPERAWIDGEVEQLDRGRPLGD